MAWNEPGNNNDRDPWGGNRGGQDGPPDLDEVVRKLQGKLGAIFGGSGGGSGSGQGASLGGGAIGLILVGLLVVWALLGVYQVDEKERAVILRLGKYVETVNPGLHWYAPGIETKHVVLVTEERQFSARGLMLTEDESIVEVPVSVQYNIADPVAFILRVRDPEISLRHATDSAIRHVVGSTQSSDVLSEGREALGGETKERLQAYLDDYQTGINVTRVNILKAEPPTEVKAAFDDVIAAKEDKDRFKNEAETYANGIVPEARGQAQRIIQDAVGYRERVIAEAEGEAQRFEKLLAEYQKAPEVTRNRLYLDAVQEVMSNSSKVMVDVEGGNNMLYLPLDKIVQSAPASGLRSRSSNLNTDQVNQIANEVIEKLRREQQTRTRYGREGR